MRKSYHVFLAVILSFSPYAAAFGEEIRDYYAEPGLNPFKEALNQDLNGCSFFRMYGLTLIVCLI
jgi:hypothetical protein